MLTEGCVVAVYATVRSSTRVGTASRWWTCMAAQWPPRTAPRPREPALTPRTRPGGISAPVLLGIQERDARRIVTTV